MVLLGDASLLMVRDSQQLFVDINMHIISISSALLSFGGLTGDWGYFLLLCVDY